MTTTMRFFLVRIIIFTVLFTILLLLLSWIAPTWTGNMVTSLTSRWPVAERSVESDRNLIVTDLSPSHEDKTNQEHVEENRDEEDNNTEEDTDITNSTDNEELEDEEDVTTIITVDKETDYNQEAAIDAMDEMLGIDNNTTTSTIETTETEDEETETTTVNNIPSPTTLSPEEQALLEEFERNTH